MDDAKKLLIKLKPELEDKLTCFDDETARELRKKLDLSSRAAHSARHLLLTMLENNFEPPEGTIDDLMNFVESSVGIYEFRTLELCKYYCNQLGVDFSKYIKS